MRAVVQVTRHAAVTVDSRVVGEIPFGLCVYLGVGPQDDESVAKHFADRIATLRVFRDGDGKMNLDCSQAGGQVLVISQFTLFADTSRGHRPSFTGAGPPQLAQTLCDGFTEHLRSRGLTVATGEFAAHMGVDAVVDGPVTLVLSSSDPEWRTDAG